MSKKLSKRGMLVSSRERVNGRLCESANVCERESVNDPLWDVECGNGGAKTESVNVMVDIPGGDVVRCAALPRPGVNVEVALEEGDVAAFAGKTPVESYLPGMGPPPVVRTAKFFLDTGKVRPPNGRGNNGNRDGSCVAGV